MFKFEILHQSKKSKARVGRIHTPHGIIDTPSFVGVGTNGTIKAIDNKIANSMLQLMFCNTYHLLLQPGPKIIKKAGGIHKFINRDLPIITDSGGFQVYSLAKSRRITEEGVHFQSPINGDAIFLGPEEAIAVQHGLNSDIVMIFDECTPYPASEAQAQTSMELSLR